MKQSIILSLVLLLAIVQGAQAQESAQEYITVYANYDTQTNWAEFNGEQVGSFTIHNRTLYKDGKWHTLCLPFDLPIAGSVLNGADVRTLSSSSFESGELTLNFTPALDETGAVTKIEAGVPYIIKWAVDHGDLDYLNFGTVTLNTTLHNVATDWVDFVGTYSPCYITTEDKSMLYLGDDNTLYYPSTAMTIGLCRAYFRLKKGLTAGETTSGNSNQSIKSFVLNFGDDTETGIFDVRSKTEEERGDGVIYNIAGQRLNKPQRGINIINGKKVVIK